MDLGKKFGFDEELAEGTWIEVGSDGTKLKLAATGNAAYEKFLAPHRQKCRATGDDLPEAVFEEAYAKFILLDWQGVEDEGMGIKPTDENRLAMLRKYPGFKALVITQASTISNFQRKAEAAEIKN